MERVSKKQLQVLVDKINEQVKGERYVIQVNYGQYCFCELCDSVIYNGAFGDTYMWLSAREMYYYLSGVLKAVSAIRQIGGDNILVSVEDK